MIARNKLIKYLNSTLNPERAPERSYVNGLEVQGCEKVKTIVGVVSPSLRLFKKAKELHADTILAHHGLIRLEQKPITGTYYHRLKLLLENNINYISYHIPLDIHSVFGNNAQLVKLLNIKDKKPFGSYHGIQLGYSGIFPTTITNSNQLEKYIFSKIKIKPITIIWPTSIKKIESISIISGGGARIEYPEETRHEEIDCYVSGNIDEGMVSLCEELKIVYVALGHYNSERWGVKALGKHLQQKYNLKFNFLEDKSEKW